MVFKQVIGRWFSLEDWPGFGINDILPPVNHQGMSWALFATACILLDTPSCKVSAFFHQKISNFSGPGSLQFFFFFITFLVDVDSSVNSSFRGSWTLSLIASLTSPSHGAEGSPLLSCSHVIAAFRTYSLPWPSNTFFVRFHLFEAFLGRTSGIRLELSVYLSLIFSCNVLVPFSVFSILTFDSHLQAPKQIAVCKLLIASFDFSFLSLSIYCLSLTFSSQPWRLIWSS